MNGRIDRRLCVAPMMDCTDRFDRYFLRLISRRALLYTEMVTGNTMLLGRADKRLAFDPAEHPLAVQIGGSEPVEMARCARLAEDMGYDEININVGCPSDRVHQGRFGACLMAEPGVVAKCVAVMKAAVSIPVTVKTRIGIDGNDDYAFLRRFVATVADAGCACFIVHARKAWLAGLSPRENREIPPLRYDRVLRLKKQFPGLEIVINGGIKSLDQASAFLADLDGVMIGRAAYQNPWLLATADESIFGDAPTRRTRLKVLEDYLPFVEKELGQGTPLHRMTRHITGLFQGLPGARAWRRHLSERSHGRLAGPEVIREAASLVSDPMT